jgi:hypothetical protein
MYIMGITELIVLAPSLADLVSTLAFAPVFVANLIGIMIGGIVEYAALLTGYQALLLPVAAFYATALLLARRGHAMIEQPAE